MSVFKFGLPGRHQKFYRKKRRSTSKIEVKINQSNIRTFEFFPNSWKDFSLITRFFLESLEWEVWQSSRYHQTSPFWCLWQCLFFANNPFPWEVSRSLKIGCCVLFCCFLLGHFVIIWFTFYGWDCSVIQSHYSCSLPFINFQVLC